MEGPPTPLRTYGLYYLQTVSMELAIPFCEGFQGLENNWS